MDEDTSSIASSSQNKGRKLTASKVVRSVRNAVMSTKEIKEDRRTFSRTRQTSNKQKDISKDNELTEMDAENTPDEQQLIAVEIQQTEDTSFKKITRKQGKEILVPEEEDNADGKSEKTIVYKGKGKETQQENEGDNNSINSEGSNNSYFAEWRVKLNLKRYVARAKATLFKGKNTGKKLSNITKELENKINYSFARMEYRKKSKGAYISLFFEDRKEWEKILEHEFQTDAGEKFKMEGKPLNSSKLSKKYEQKRAIIWDLPVNWKKQELVAEIERKYGKVEFLSMYVGGMWQKAHVTFKDAEDTKNFLKEWSQIIGDDVVRVTVPGVPPQQLKDRGQYAVRAVGIPQGMTPKELYNYVTTFGAKTCYVPRNGFYARKRMAIISVESQEIMEGLIGQEWITDDFNIKLIDITKKTCHRCHDQNHLVKDCPLNGRDEERNHKYKEQLDKFGNIWKKHNIGAYNRIQRNLDPSYSGVLKGNNNNNNTNIKIMRRENMQPDNDMVNKLSQQMEQLQIMITNNAQMLNKVIRRLEKLEEILDVPEEEEEEIDEGEATYEDEDEDMNLDQESTARNILKQKQPNIIDNDNNVNNNIIVMLENMYKQQENMATQLSDVVKRQNQIEQKGGSGSQ